MMKNWLLLLFIVFSSFVSAQEKLEFVSPFDFPLLLSANFGELRPNHFHGGLDIKTQGVTGKPVHVVAGGYVSRITVSPSGYGNALFVTHPNGYISVYGHLESFSPKIANYVRQQQYKMESFSVDLSPDSTLFPVNQGDVIAFSGNSGSSGGPHLHLEFRKISTNEMIDPMPFYMSLLTDKRRPVSTGVRLYAKQGEGVINGIVSPRNFLWAKGGKGLTSRVDAWGKIGVAIKANDYMTGTSNVYGVRSIKLFVDSTEIFRCFTDKVGFDENRAINGLIDYDVYRTTRAFYAKSFLLPGNRLRLVQSKMPERGWVTIDEERDYYFVYQLEDAFGNKSEYSFTVHGRRQPLPKVTHSGNQILHWDCVNTITRPGMQLVIPRGMLYEDTDVVVGMKADSSAIAYTYQLHNKPLPLHDYCPLCIGVRSFPVADSTKYYIAEKSGRSLWYVGGTWRDGWLEARIRTLGTYTVAIDTVAPKIVPLNSARWARTGTAIFRISDGQTGIKSYKCKIDGKFVLFECNRYYNRLTCRLRDAGLERGKLHRVEMEVMDLCGNVSISRLTFRY